MLKRASELVSPVCVVLLSQAASCELTILPIWIRRDVTSSYMGGKAWHIRTKAGSVGMKNSLNLSPGSTVNLEEKQKGSMIYRALCPPWLMSSYMGGKAWHIRTKAGSAGMKNSLNLSPGSTVNLGEKQKGSMIYRALSHPDWCLHTWVGKLGIYEPKLAVSGWKMHSTCLLVVLWIQEKNRRVQWFTEHYATLIDGFIHGWESLAYTNQSWQRRDEKLAQLVPW